MKLLPYPVLAFGLLALSWPAGAAAQGRSAVRGALAQFRHEPTAAETVRESLRYFRVDPESFDHLRSTARSRGWMPLLAGGYSFSDDRGRRGESEVFQPRQFDERTNTQVHSATAGAVWDLRELVFNPAEVQVYGLIGVQRDLMLEVTRTFYLRRQLQLRLLLRPPDDALAYAALEMRVSEFTAILDVLSGGWFTEESARRRPRRRREDAD